MNPIFSALLVCSIPNILCMFACLHWVININNPGVEAHKTSKKNLFIKEKKHQQLYITVASETSWEPWAIRHDVSDKSISIKSFWWGNKWEEMEEKEIRLPQQHEVRKDKSRFNSLSHFSPFLCKMDVDCVCICVCVSVYARRLNSQPDCIIYIFPDQMENSFCRYCQVLGYRLWAHCGLGEGHQRTWEPTPNTAWVRDLQPCVCVSCHWPNVDINSHFPST